MQYWSQTMVDGWLKLSLTSLSTVFWPKRHDCRMNMEKAYVQLNHVYDVKNSATGRYGYYCKPATILNKKCLLQSVIYQWRTNVCVSLGVYIWSAKDYVSWGGGVLSIAVQFGFNWWFSIAPVFQRCCLTLLSRILILVHHRFKP